MFATSCHPNPWAFLFMSRRRGHRHHGGGPPPWVIEMLGRRGPRAERGDVRYLILDALSEQARHGYEIIQVIADRTGGAYKPSPGTVYPTLQMLEELGHVRSREEEGRRVYEITDDGRAELEAHAEEVEEAWDRLSAEADWFEAQEFRDLFRRFGRLMRRLGRSLHRGQLGGETMREIHSIIAEALARIEALVKAEPED